MIDFFVLTKTCPAFSSSPASNGAAKQCHVVFTLNVLYIHVYTHRVYSTSTRRATLYGINAEALHDAHTVLSIAYERRGEAIGLAKEAGRVWL